MASTIPTTMQAIGVTAYGKPDTYDVLTVPTPTVEKHDEVLVKVHAASINPIDVKQFSGMMKMMNKEKFPLTLGYDAAGVVEAVGSGVTTFKVGDEVYSRVPADYMGTVAEYVIMTESTMAKKPSNINLSQAAAIPLAALTALQSMENANKRLEGGLKGKTVFISAGLSGTGHFALQLAKNVFSAGKIITTLSTPKIAQAKALLGDSPIVQMVDYTTTDVVTTIGKGTVDYMFDTTGSTNAYSAVMKSGGVIISISTLPSGDSLVTKGMTDMPFFIRALLNLLNWVQTAWLGRGGVQYEFVFMDPDRDGLELLAKYVEEGKVTPIVGRTANFGDVQAVRDGCQQIYDAKGGTGKFVIEMVTPPA